MTVTEIWIGVPATEKAQQEKLDQGYEIQPHTSGGRHGRYVMAHRPATYFGEISQCINAAVQVFGLTRERLFGELRATYRARAAAIWAARNLGYSLPRIARAVNRDPTTVMHAHARCEEFQAECATYRTQCERVMSMVRSA